MSTVRYTLKVSDDEFTNLIDLTSVEYERRFCFERELTYADDLVSIDTSTYVGEQALIFLSTSSPIDIYLVGTGGTPVRVDSVFFCTHGLAIEAIQNLDETVTAVVKLYVYAEAPTGGGGLV